MLKYKNNYKKRSMIKDKKINWKNKKLMSDKILSYSPELIEGINKYNDANIKFTFLLLLTTLCISIPMVSLVVCTLTVIYLVKMFKLIRFRNIKNIVNTLSRDLAFRGIYDKGKVEMFLDDFVEKYGDDIIEYDLLINMIDKYEVLVNKIEFAIRNITTLNEEDSKEDINYEAKLTNEYVNEEHTTKKIDKNKGILNKKFALIYKNEEGEIKKINKAIEFFDNKASENDNSNTVVLKSNKKGEQSKLTVYLHKKSAEIPENRICKMEQ